MQIKSYYKHFKFKPAFIAGELVVPTLLATLDAIEKLFLKMEETLLSLENDPQFDEDFFVSFKRYYLEKARLLEAQDILEDQIKSQALDTKKLLFNGIKLHIEECKKELSYFKNMESKERDYEKIMVFMVKAEHLLVTLKHSKEELLNLVVSQISIKSVEKDTGKILNESIQEEERAFTTISLSPFNHLLSKIISYCEGGLETINSWKTHLPERRILKLQQKVLDDQKKVSIEQTKMYYWVFIVQIGFIVLAILSIIATS